MKIVIIGDGKVGSALAAQLSAEHHDVVLVDKNIKSLTLAQDTMDVLTIVGNGASYEVQCEAGVQDADLLLATTSLDETNLLCCLLAKKLGCKNTIARVRTPEYEQQVDFLKDELGLSMTVNPERNAAAEIHRILQIPSFLKRDSFAHGRVELVELKLEENNPLIGKSLMQMYDIVKTKVLVCAVERNGEVVIPSGNFVLQADDMLTVTAATKDLVSLVDRLSISKQKVKDVIIVGGSRISVTLAKELIQSGMNVKIIEIDKEKCKILSEILPEALIINGDGSMQELLLQEDIHNTDAIVTLTGSDEENIVISMFANAMGVHKTVTKISRAKFGDVFGRYGLDSVIDPKKLIVHKIVRFVRAMVNSTGESMISMHGIVKDKAEALEFKVSDSVKNLSVPLREIKFRPHILIASISRKGKIIIPTGNDTLELGDTVVVVVAKNQTIINLNDIFAND